MDKKTYDAQIANISLLIDLPNINGGQNRQGVSIWVNPIAGTFGFNGTCRTPSVLNSFDLAFISRVVERVVECGKMIQGVR